MLPAPAEPRDFIPLLQLHAGTWSQEGISQAGLALRHRRQQRLRVLASRRCWKVGLAPTTSKGSRHHPRACTRTDPTHRIREGKPHSSALLLFPNTLQMSHEHAVPMVSPWALPTGVQRKEPSEQCVEKNRKGAAKHRDKGTSGASSPKLACLMEVPSAPQRRARSPWQWLPCNSFCGAAFSWLHSNNVLFLTGFICSNVPGQVRVMVSPRRQQLGAGGRTALGSRHPAGSSWPLPTDTERNAVGRGELASGDEATPVLEQKNEVSVTAEPAFGGSRPCPLPALPSHSSSEQHRQPQPSCRGRFANTAWPGRRFQPVFWRWLSPSSSAHNCCLVLASCSLLSAP